MEKIISPNESGYDNKDKEKEKEEYEDEEYVDIEEYYEVDATEEHLLKRKRQLEQYNSELRIHKRYAAPEIKLQKTIIKKELKKTGFQPSIIGLASWSVYEKAAFFHALERVGRDPQAISARVKTKSPVLCGAYLELLSEESRNVPARIPGGNFREAIAFEASQAWVEFEEKLAAELLAEEAKSNKFYVENRPVKFRRADNDKKLGGRWKRRHVDESTVLKSKSFFYEDRLYKLIQKTSHVPKQLPPLATTLDLYLIMEKWLTRQIKEVVAFAKSEKTKVIDGKTIHKTFKIRGMTIMIETNGIRKGKEEETQGGKSEDDKMIGGDAEVGNCGNDGDNEMEIDDKERQSNEESIIGKQTEDESGDKSEENDEGEDKSEENDESEDKSEENDESEDKSEENDENEDRSEENDESEDKSEENNNSEDKEERMLKLERFSAVDLVSAQEACSLLNWKYFPPPSEDLLRDTFDTHGEFIELKEDHLTDIRDRRKDLLHDERLWQQVEEIPRLYVRISKPSRRPKKDTDDKRKRNVKSSKCREIGYNSQT